MSRSKKRKRTLGRQANRPSRTLATKASMAHSTVGRITHNGTEHASREKRRYLAYVTLDDPYPVLHAITDHILLGEHR